MLKAAYILAEKGDADGSGRLFVRCAEAGVPEAMFEVA